MVAAGSPTGARRRGLRRAGDRGSATAELAAGLPAVALVLVLVLIVGSAAIAQVRCADAARAAARAAALGEDAAAVTAIALDLAGEDAHVEVSTAEGWVHVVVTRPVSVGWLGLEALSARSEASVPLEPGEP